MSDPVEMDPIQLTPDALNQVAKLLAREQDTNLKLRIYVTGGGCSGFQYGFAFDDQVAEDDWVLHKADFTLLVDAMSLHYMTGVTIDFKESLEGARFVITNPNASATCGCGSSFSV